MNNSELVEIVDELGISTGLVIDKEEAHDKNLLHKEVSLFIINSKKEILLEKRSPNKRFAPNKWGLCAGHVQAYEDIDAAMIRELKEELGVSANKKDLHYFLTLLKKRTENSNISYDYYMHLDKNINDFIVQEEELSEVKWFSFNDIKNMIINNDPLITFSNNPDNLKALDELDKIIDFKS